MAMQTRKEELYPAGDALKRSVRTRQTRGVVWQTIFLLATLIGIIALMALLYNVITGAFGYVAVQNKVDPGTIVLELYKEKLLATPNLITSEQDEDLVAAVLENTNAIGFFGYAYYQGQQDQLRALSVDGVAPSAETVNSGDYKLARPLFIYTSAKTLLEKPQVAAFVDYYLTNVNAQIGEVGYFSAGAKAIEDALAQVKTAIQGAAAGRDATGAIQVAGSSTVYPLTVYLADQFKATGFTGKIAIENIGTMAGLARFCKGNQVDIANASRAINRQELDACHKARREPLELRVGTDALAIVVSQQNQFLTSVTSDELRKIFTTAEKWSDVNPAWPNQPIQRVTPGIDSGTLDFFVESLFDRNLADLSQAELVTILKKNVSKGLLRRLESDQPFAERTAENVYELVRERVVEPTIVQSWSLRDSLLHRTEIELTTAQIPNGELTFRSWLHPAFLTAVQSTTPELAGVRTAILGSVWVILITIFFSLPVGVGAAIYLEEYAEDNNVNRLIETNINNLAGVPSIIYGLLGLAIFVRFLEPLTSGKLFGLADPTTANGRTVLSAGLTLGLLILPLIIINAREAIRAVPNSLRQASYGLGATQWQTIWHHVLPSALPGIMTGAILSISRAIGETAPLVVIGASTFIVIDPNGPFAKFTTLPIQIYQWTSRPQAEFHNIAAAAIIVLLVMLLTLNASAVLIRSRFSRRA